MDCPQCGAEIPSDDSFCGKCGYAMRDHTPERPDQSRIRVHEEPDRAAEDQPGRSSPEQRIRQRTMYGIPPATPPEASPPKAPSPPSPPTSLSSVRSGRTRSRTPQKTKLGIPRLEPRDKARAGSSAEPIEGGQSPFPVSDDVVAPVETHRQRTRVRYDSSNEPLSVIQRRRKVLGGLGVLVLLAAAWLGYRFLTLNG